ncbi:MAG: hypothetical protein ACLFUZ_04810 [Candidatus Micrarchaeia archaeon]
MVNYLWTFLLILGLCFAATPITECTTVSAPGQYYLANDIINNTADPCIQITTDNILLDCAHHYLEASEGGIGASLSGTPSNITIANCSIYSSNDGQIMIRGSGEDFHFLNLELNGSAPSLAFQANQSEVYNLSSNGTWVADMGNVSGITIQNITGTRSSPGKISAESILRYSILDLHNVWIDLTDASNGTVENIYCSNQANGGCYVLNAGTPTSVLNNNTLRNAYFSDCQFMGFPAPCFTYPKSIGSVYFYEVELVRPPGLYFPPGFVADGIRIVNASGGAGIGGNSIVRNMNISLDASAGDPAFVAFGDSVRVSNVDIQLRDSLQTGIAVATPFSPPLSNSMFEDFDVSGGAKGLEVQNALDNVTFSDVSMDNMAMGVALSREAKDFTVDGLVITNASDAGVKIESTYMVFPCDEPLGHQFTDVIIRDSESGIVLTGATGDVCDVRFSGVEAEVDDAGFLVEAEVSRVSLDDFNISVSDNTGVGMNLSRNYFSNYTNGEVSGGEYCIWTYHAKENNSYAGLELHDCDTGFLLGNTVTPPVSNYVNNTGIHIHDVLLAYDISNFWYPVIFEEVFFGENAVGMGMEFSTFGCIDFNSVAQPAPLPHGYTEFLGNYLEVREFDSNPACADPTHYAFMNETGFLWTAEQESGYDMSTLKVLKWNGTNWSEVPGTLDLSNRIYEAGHMENFSIFTLAAETEEPAPSDDGNGGREEAGPISLSVPEGAYVLETVIIQAFDKNGDPLNAKISVEFDGETIFSEFAGPDGEAEVVPMEEGVYAVSAYRYGYESPFPSEFVASPRQLDVSIPSSVYEGERFAVVVVSGEELLEGANVGIGNLLQVCGEDGTVHFTLFHPGEYEVKVSKDGYVSWSGVLEVLPEQTDEESEEGTEEGEPAEEDTHLPPEEEEPAEEEEPFSVPVSHGEVPSVEEPRQPVSKEAKELQQYYLWILLLLIIAAGAYWIYKNRKGK